MGVGKFIVIEGTDGSGKKTQYDLLVSRLEQEGHRIKRLDFPRYAEPSGYFVKKYLNGGYGTLQEIGPYQASLFYALDRFDARADMLRDLAAGLTLVANRYVGSNLAHQGAKISDAGEREKFFRWIYELEYRTLGVPQPTINIFLHVPSAIAYELIAKKEKRDYIGGAARDIHEADKDHLVRAEETYREMTRVFPGEFAEVECAPQGELLPIEAVHELVWSEVKKHL